MNLLPQRYWDSNAFLGWLNNEQECFGICNALIEDARSGKHRLVTSTLTYAEVFWIRGGLPQPHQINAIKALFEHSWIVPAELDHPTADLARELMFEFSRNDGLQAKDAVHLATAIRARALGNVECFDTWDGGLANLGGAIDASGEASEGGFGGRSIDWHPQGTVTPSYFFQRARAAFLAIWRRRFADSFCALARPPFNPPKRPSATAAGFFRSLCAASSDRAMTCWTASNAD